MNCPWQTSKVISKKTILPSTYNQPMGCILPPEQPTETVTETFVFLPCLEKSCPYYNEIRKNCRRVDNV
jgi:hypothetical protein